MDAHTLFISDLHLQPEHPHITDAFIELMRTRAPMADALYILGDFFEVWVGDDDRSAFNEQIKTELYHATQAGLPVYFMWGNRDFLIGKQFAADTGVVLINDPTPISLYGKKYLLMHGDSLCTDDTKHQAFRKKTRNTLYRQLFLSQPLSWRRSIARKVRKKSMVRNLTLTPDIMDITHSALDDISKNYEIDCVIHGHTHRPMISGSRIVLGAWHKNASILSINSTTTHFLDN
jgi:UDP-2,3-diacylglucosamine hydrolase